MPSNDKTLLVIFGYGGDKERVERHMRHFLRARCDIVLVSPVDNPLIVEGCATFFSGRSEHHGPELIKRHIQAFIYAADLEYDAYCFIEADSLIFHPIPKHPGNGLRCIIWENHNKPRFKADTYLHWPLWMDRSTLDRILENCDGADIEEGFPDRWLGLLTERIGMKVTHEPLAFSRNQLDTPLLMDAGVEAVKKGAIWVHGVKTKAQFDELIQRTSKAP